MPQAEPKIVRKGETNFRSDGQLLSELGERLVATPHLALSELIKNAYDADSVFADVSLLAGKSPSLRIHDRGHGMTEDDFLSSWMTVASSNKLRTEVSRTYKRRLCGSKGVGRFAVRLLGRSLILKTVAYDKKEKAHLQLSATFDWDAYRAGDALEAIKVQYKLESGFSAADEGTELIIGKLQADWNEQYLREVSNHVLEIVRPPGFDWLERHFQPEKDPGFEVRFGDPQTEAARVAGEEVFDRYVSRVMIQVRERNVRFEYEYDGEPSRKFAYKLPENLVGNVKGEVRYFPRRAGVFRGLGSVDGRRAHTWIRQQSGVKVIDRGFQMPPYGDENDDWLRLSADKASRSREWGSTITKSFFPEDERDMSEKNDPLLKVPHNNQLLGAIAVESYRPPTVKKADGQAVAQLQPAMDRQGFVANAGFGQLRDIIRASVELFAVIDVEETSARRRKEAQQAASQARREISKAIERVRQDDTIARPAKAQILSNYERIAAQVTRVEEVQAEARKAVETMSLLGVLSGFMTHETTATLRAVERMQALLKRIPVAQRPTHFDETMEATTAAVEQLKSHIDYAQTFIRGVKKAPDRPFKVLPQMRLVARQMESFCQERGITIRNEIGASLESPKGLPVSVYSGVALNLLTNAIKAILARKDPENATIMFSADSDQAWHWLKVSDSGIGVPDEIGDQIFEPLFTTTGEGPLGLGMGLGLHIVRRVVEEFRGRIALVDPEDGFATTFEIRFPT